jgi:hypothetical protein
MGGNLRNQRKAKARKHWNRHFQKYHAILNRHAQTTKSAIETISAKRPAAVVVFYPLWMEYLEDLCEPD